MALATLPPETDLLLPCPEPGEQWDPHTINTHYFGFSVPEAGIGAFLYLRWQPAFPLSQGGVCVFQGTDNVEHTDMAYLDYEMTMPWPEVDGNVIRTANGLQIAFEELGQRARITYASPDGETRIDVLQEAVTPLLARGHVMPGEEAHHAEQVAGGHAPGGSEQFMHVTGELVLHGETHAVDCFSARDRSWRQVRVESRDAVPVPPIGWSPMYFGEDLVFNQISFEPEDSDPLWKGVYQVGDRPTHHFAWILIDGEMREVVKVRRTVHERHPRLGMAIRQDVEAEDETGQVHRFTGEAIATASLPAWPNTSFHDSVFRWEAQDGRVAHCTYQELWFQPYQHAVRRQAAAAAVGA